MTSRSALMAEMSCSTSDYQIVNRS